MSLAVTCRVAWSASPQPSAASVTGPPWGHGAAVGRCRQEAGPPCYSNSLPPAGKETCRASLWPEGQTTRLNAVASVASFPFTSCPARWTVGVDLPMKQGPSPPYTQRKRAPQGGRGWQPTLTREPWAVSEEGRSGTVMCRHHLKNGAEPR